MTFLKHHIHNKHSVNNKIKLVFVLECFSCLKTATFAVDSSNLLIFQVLPFQKLYNFPLNCTGKSLSEARILTSTNPQYGDRFFIELQVQYKKISNSNLGRTCCVQKLFLTFRTIFVHSMFSPSSAKRRLSDKDLPLPCHLKLMNCQKY